VTYFEALTALGYLWFADKPVSVGVFEVGMGGTWDATNLVRGDVAVICPIGLDHTAILGSTVAEIAAEKAGVVKAGKRVVVRGQRPEALNVIRSRCDEVGAALLLEDDAFALASRTPAVGGQSLSVRGARGSYGDVFLPVFGEQAARNAAASIVACEELLARPLDDRLVREALAAVRVPGRMEVAARHPLVLLDGAHNADAMTALVATLRESFTWQRLHAVVGMFGDKDVEAVCRILAPLVDAGYAGMTGSPRAAPAERVAAALADAGGRDVRRFGSIGKAATAAVADAGEDDLILVTGSFYTVADARPMFVSA
jgi:dihydrofolate synthase/folylpolyglutamate synthase